MSLSTDPLYNCMTVESTRVNILMLGWNFSTYLSWPRKELAILVQIQASSFTIILTKSFCSDSVKKDVNALNFYTHFFLYLWTLNEPIYCWVFLYINNSFYIYIMDFIPLFSLSSWFEELFFFLNLFSPEP